MKSKKQKREEALARLRARRMEVIARQELCMANIRALKKQEPKGFTKLPAFAMERAAFAMERDELIRLKDISDRIQTEIVHLEQLLNPVQRRDVVAVDHEGVPVYSMEHVQ
jgi:hypothetical protein